MPSPLKQAVYAVAKLNLNKNFVHKIDPDIDLDENSTTPQSSKAKDSKNKTMLSDERIQNEQNKYNRNFILVIETVKHYTNLFSDLEK